MSKILLVGGNGYLGQYLKERLKNNFEVFYSGRSEKKEQNYLQIDFNNHITFDILKEYSFSHVLVLAADLSGLGKTELNPEYLDTNISGYAAFLTALGKYSIPSKLIFISSMTVYSASNSSPVHETACTQNPPNTYGLSKYLGEQLTGFFCHKEGIKGLAFRIPGLFGGHKEGGYLYNAIKKLGQQEDFYVNTTGLVYWECAYVVDISIMISKFISQYKWDQTFDAFNLSYGEETDIFEVARLIKKKLNSTANILEESPKGYCSFYLDNSKAKKVISIDCSLDKAIDSYIKQFSK